MTAVCVSVVVIGRNEGQRLPTCLESIKALKFDAGLEIIYVDSNSQDGSPELAASMGVKVLRIVPKHPCAAIGRNVGWREATGEFILFLDGDTRLHPDFLQLALSELQANPAIAIVWGHRRERHPEHSLFNKVLDLDWIYRPGISEFCGGDALMRRAILVHTGGYNEDLIAGEEPELCQRIRALGQQILHIDHPMTDHDLAMTKWSAYWKRALRAGFAYADVSQRLKQSDFPLWRHECQRNAVHAGILLGLLLGGLGLTLWLTDLSPLLLSLLAYSALSLRSAYKARWKSRDPLTLLLYGAHSHLQQIPIAIGQLRYWFGRIRKQHQALIEYK